jgi:hypothetical protein
MSSESYTSCLARLIKYSQYLVASTDLYNAIKGWFEDTFYK